MSPLRHAAALLVAIASLSPRVAHAEEGPIQDNSFLIE